jgi:hypothetical protein
MQATQLKATNRRNGKMILNRLRDRGCKNVECFYLPQDRMQWWALVNTVTNNRAPYEASIFGAHGQDQLLIDIASQCSLISSNRHNMETVKTNSI